MLSFRKKIFFSGVALFLLLTALLFPFIEGVVGKIMRKSLEGKARELIVKLQQGKSCEEMAEMLKKQEVFVLQRATLFYADGTVACDSEEPYLGELEKRSRIDKHPEIFEAMRKGRGYSEFYIEELDEKIANIALAFELNGQKYILKAGYSLNQLEELTLDFEIGCLCLVTLVLLLYSVMTWAVIERLSRPIQEIIRAILPYQEGEVEFLPKIRLSHKVENNEFVRLASTVNSLTEKIQKQIENLIKLRKETEGILESLGEGIIAFDLKGNITFVNGAALKILKAPQSKVIGKTFRQIESAPTGLVDEASSLVEKTLLVSKPTSGSWVQREGRDLFLDLITAPLSEKEGAVLVLQDKTSDYKVVEMGKDFIANASHELKTPITIILGFAETLQDLPNLSPEMQKEIVEKIVRTCGRLDKLVKSLLTLADIENFSEKQFRRCDLIALGENCKHLLLTVHPKAKVNIISRQKSISAVIDPDLFELGLMNLLENAVKYSPAPANIEVLIEKKSREVMLSVKDQGIGIPEKDLPHIFDRFYTVDKARSRKSGGAGLGLSIVKTIIEKHKGSIEVSSKKGTHFLIKLPL